MNDLIIEKCQEENIVDYPCFYPQLEHIQKYLEKIGRCKKTNSYIIYALGNIIWRSDLRKLMSRGRYPSDYFIKTVINTNIINDVLTNPPMKITKDDINRVKYVTITHNHLLIMDALMKQGSNKRYQSPLKNKYLYSEHSGALKLRDYVVDEIVIFTNTDRSDHMDQNILLPNNSINLLNYEFIFHTHPNTDVHGGRIDEGIIYEFPSSNDIFNFVKYHNEGRAEASIIIAPEGCYIIRLRSLNNIVNYNNEDYETIYQLILKLERMAKKDKLHLIDKIKKNEDDFHKYVSHDARYIQMLNRSIKKNNIFIEYYPREKKNNEWHLRPLNLMCLS